MQINERMMLVGSGKYGSLISDSMDCNVYLLDGGAECALIDAGGGVDPQRIVANIEKAGIAMARVKYLLLTHAHADHAAGAAFFQTRYGMQVIAANEAVPWLEQADMDKTSFNAAKRGGVYAPDFQFPGCAIARGVSENESIQIGELALKVLETPGHSRGHVSFLLEHEGRKALFAGDTIFAGGKVVIQNIWDCSIQDYAETVAKLHSLHIDSLMPGHGPFLVNEAWRHVEMAQNCFNRLDVPPNL
ncbi:MBL fold metallo-hydrolase [Paenibacillus eucommiae]|uniref:Glyoxylase-like metal-dependent hydrolase (Beta-lactamase superfamily II) n=1 Tax=Paenibacillus eucommiae TaxID=1355755 RepID=A0ABS4INK6_9BACL|nr:MBL fold metallo-hydrolase [Paenibacillus eucommiae]MBP1988750.1 glyoxylase-like metal-dependent hydrolase (beta-lactamase superfamily II) [Paenibacillus eucommiae]